MKEIVKTDGVGRFKKTKTMFKMFNESNGWASKLEKRGWKRWRKKKTKICRRERTHRVTEKSDLRSKWERGVATLTALAPSTRWKQLSDHHETRLIRKKFFNFRESRAPPNGLTVVCPVVGRRRFSVLVARERASSRPRMQSKTRDVCVMCLIISDTRFVETCKCFLGTWNGFRVQDEPSGGVTCSAWWCRVVEHGQTIPFPFCLACDYYVLF